MVVPEAGLVACFGGGCCSFFFGRAIHSVYPDNVWRLVVADIVVSCSKGRFGCFFQKTLFLDGEDPGVVVTILEIALLVEGRRCSCGHCWCCSCRCCCSFVIDRNNC